jgi:hypothetical protein
MKYLENKFIRIIICLFLGGAVSELIHISTGDPNRPQETNLSILYAIAFYIGFSLYLKRNKIKKDY